MNQIEFNIQFFSYKKFLYAEFTQQELSIIEKNMMKYHNVVWKDF